MKLKIDADTVFAFKGQPGFVRADFDGEGYEVELTKRQIFPVQGKLRAFDAKVPVGSSSTKYSVSEPINAGEVWLLGAKVKGGSDPEVWATVCCVRVPPEKQIGFADPPKITSGGTYCHFNSTSSESFFVRIWVSEQPIPPETARPALVDEVHPELSSIKSALSTGTAHALYFEPIAPGTNYHYLIQYIDRLGDSGSLSGTFTTKQRKVEVTIGDLTVVDDGDNLSSGEAELIVAIWKNDQVINSKKWGDDVHPISIDDTTPTIIDVKMHQVIGPEPGDFQVGINAHGREFDTFSDELASTGDAVDLWRPWLLPFSTGVNENFTFSQTVAVPTVNQETFAFKLDVKCVVSYL